AADILSEAAQAVGSTFIDVRLPNVFGEHGRPFYNSVAATFSHMLSRGETPVIDVDKELSLLHAQDAADILLGRRKPNELGQVVERESVSGLLTRLERQAQLYRSGDIPDVSSAFDRNLFNTYRSYSFKAQRSIPLQRRADTRGSFFE